MGALLKDVITEHAKATADKNEVSARPSIREEYQHVIEELDQRLAREREAIDELGGQLERVGGYAGEIEVDGTLPPPCLAFSSPVRYFAFFSWK